MQGFEKAVIQLLNGTSRIIFIEIKGDGSIWAKISSEDYKGEFVKLFGKNYTPLYKEV